MKRLHLIHRLGLGLALVAGLGIASEVQAAVPGNLMHQGRLFDADGVPVDAILNVTFAIYANEDDPMPMWTESIDVAFDDGFFSAQLGDNVPFDPTIFDGSTRWLGVQVDDDPEMAPRARIGSVPYAFMAGDVNGAIHPTSVDIEGYGPVIDETGNWVGAGGGAGGATGPTGPIGTTGPIGAIGPTGATGAAGVTGATGPAGVTGATGATGIQGPTGPGGGDPGATGATGAQGPAGVTGATGPAGAQGVAGPTGAAGGAGVQGPTGPAGAQGVAGPTGAAGGAGVQGPTGPAGAQGVAGPTGAAGAAGVQGPTGAQGIQGIQGATGAVGAAGAAGSQGPIGPTGPAGAAGSNGAAGVTGPTGAAGAQGVVGPTGPAGANGSDGADGATGATGPAGPQGPTGLTGAAGAAGSNGTNGTNGSDGADGATGPTGPAGSQGVIGPTGAPGANGSDGATGATGEQGIIAANTNRREMDVAVVDSPFGIPEAIQIFGAVTIEPTQYLFLQGMIEVFSGGTGDVVNLGACYRLAGSGDNWTFVLTSANKATMTDPSGQTSGHTFLVPADGIITVPVTSTLELGVCGDLDTQGDPSFVQLTAGSLSYLLINGTVG